MMYSHLDLCQSEVPTIYVVEHLSLTLILECRVSNVPQRPNPTTETTNVEPPMMMAI